MSDPTEPKGKILKFPDRSSKAGKKLREITNSSKAGLLNSDVGYVIIPESLLQSIHQIGTAVHQLMQEHEALITEVQGMFSLTATGLRKVQAQQAETLVTVLSALQDVQAELKILQKALLLKNSPEEHPSE